MRSVKGVRRGLDFAGLSAVGRDGKPRASVHPATWAFRVRAALPSGRRGNSKRDGSPSTGAAGAGFC
jgi:hypothetical protein